MPSDPQGARVPKLASVCGGDSREVPPPHPFHSSDVDIVSVSFSLETKVHPVASPEEKVSEAKGKAVGEKVQPQYLWASREEFPVVHSETRGTCYLRVSAFDVIGALRRFGVEPGTSCTA